MSDQGDLPLQSLAFVELMYEQYCADPNSVDAEWRAYFNGWNEQNTVDSVTLRDAKPQGLFSSQSIPSMSDATLVLQERLDGMIRAYRVRGHVKAKLDPLGLPRAGHPELEPARYGFEDADLERVFSAKGIHGPDQASLREILNHLEETYCGHIGVQFMHIDDLKIKSWIQHRVESTRNRFKMSRSLQLRVLSKLTDAEVFEQFIHRKFLGAKAASRRWRIINSSRRQLTRLPNRVDRKRLSRWHTADD